MQLPDWAPEDIDPTVPSLARSYDHLLGGVHHFEADRQLSEAGIAVWPDLPLISRANRAFVRRAVTFLVREAGISQFLDIGSGIPTAGNVHEIAQRFDPNAKVAYVDIDPVAVIMSRKILEDDPNAVAVRGDFNDIERVLSDPAIRGLLDFTRPVGVLIVGMLDLVPDEADPAATLARIRDELAPGSHLALGDLSDEAPPEQIEKVVELTRRTPNPITFRSRDRIAAFFDGYDLVEPGLVHLNAWHPDPGEAATEPMSMDGYCGVGRLRYRPA